MKRTATVLHEGAEHPSPRQGATQTGVEEVTNRFKKYEPYVFSSHFDGKPLTERLGKVWQYRIKNSFLENTFSKLPSYLKKVAKNIKELDIRIVHVRNRPLYMPVLRKLLGSEYKLILHEHNQNIADTLTNKQAIDVFESIDAYVGVSQFTHDFELSRYPQYHKKCRAILNGVNLEKFRPYWEQKQKAHDIRWRYGVEGKKVILFAGAIRERKGVHSLVEAFRTVNKFHPDATLVIAGGSKDNTEATDAYAKKVVSLAHGLPVIFTGYIPPKDINNVYLLGDIFVGPSIWDEAFGLVFAEASACGLAVIGSKRGGIPEIIKDEKTGLLINDPEDPQEIAQKIISLLDSPKKIEEYGKAAREYMEQSFSWDRTAREIEALYDELSSK
jgi:spore coat protein SA